MARARPIPFVFHQAFEYLCAGALVELSVHLRHSSLLVIAAVCLALSALTARGPLGIARVCAPRVHALLDGVLAVALAAAPILPALRPGLEGTVVVEIVAVGLVRVSTLTRYVRVAAVPVDDAASALTSGAAGADARRFGPALARGLGYATGRTAERLPDAEAALRRSARHVSARWPGAEAALRRGTRRAVRHAARLARARRDNTT
jgi:hypothetical protein